MKKLEQTEILAFVQSTAYLFCLLLLRGGDYKLKAQVGRENFNGERSN